MIFPVDVDLLRFHTDLAFLGRRPWPGLLHLQVEEQLTPSLPQVFQVVCQQYPR